MVSVSTIPKLLIGGLALVFTIAAVSSFKKAGGFEAPAQIGKALGESATGLAQLVTEFTGFFQGLGQQVGSLFGGGDGITTTCGVGTKDPLRQPFTGVPFCETGWHLYQNCCVPDETTTTTQDDDRDGGRQGTCGGRTCPPDWYCSIETVPPGIQVQQCKPRYDASSPQEVIGGRRLPSGFRFPSSDREGTRIGTGGAIAPGASLSSALPVASDREGARAPVQEIQSILASGGGVASPSLAAYFASLPPPIHAPASTVRFESRAEFREAQERAGYRRLY